MVGAFEFILIDRRFEAATQCVFHAVMELGKERGLPRVPQSRVGRSHIGCREDVKVVEVCLVADESRKRVDHLGVGDVLFLSRQRQQQVVAHEPSHETGVVTSQSLFEAKRLGVDSAKIRVIAAAAFGNVVKERCEVRDLGARQGLHDARKIRQLVIESRQGETSQVAHHEQRVRIDRIGVEEVVLHTTDDASKRRDVAPEHTIGVHSAQFVRDTCGCA